MTFDYWYEQVMSCDSLAEMDDVMFKASEDMTLSGGDYARLCFICRERLTVDANGDRS